MTDTNLYFNGNDFTTFVNFVKSMNLRDRSKFSKIALLHVENGQLICRAIDDTSSYIEYNVELYNTENFIDEYIAIPITDLSALIKCANSDRFAIRKNLSQYEFNIIGGGWLPFKTADIDSSKFSIDGEVSEIGKINSVKLRNAISSVLNYTQEGIYPRDKYIVFTDDQMTVTSRRSSVVTKDNFVNMVLHRDDASMLKSLLKDNFELSVNKVKSAIERTLFIGKKFKFAIVTSDVAQVNINYNDSINNYLKIDCDELYKICSFSEEYSVSKHILGVTVKDGELKVSVKNILAAKHVSFIKSKQIGSVADVLTEAEIPTSNLLRVLKLFQDKKSKDINIYITEQMIADEGSVIIFDENTQAVLDICSR